MTFQVIGTRKNVSPCFISSSDMIPTVWGLYLMFFSHVQLRTYGLLFSGDLCYSICVQNILETNENRYPETFREEEGANTCHVIFSLDTTCVNP